MHSKIIYKFLTLTFLLLILLVPESCTVSVTRNLLGHDEMGGVLKDIQRRGKLIAITDDNPLNHFMLDGEHKGYQYEVLQKFANHLGVELEIIEEPDAHKALQYLKQRKVDILAMDIPSTFDVKHTIEFSEPVFKSRQVLVQRKPDNWRKMKDMKDVESLMVKNLDQFKGKTIVLPAGKETQFYLFDLQHATGNQLSIISQPESNSAKMIEAVAAKEADYTIAYAHTANALSMIYRDLDVKTPVSPEIGISWVVRKGASNLLYEMNNWIAENRNHGEFDYLYAKYYKNPRWARLALGQKVSNDRISDYDEILKQASSSIGWDWRLLAAIVYNESKFKPDAVSHRGAFGLMQLMPETAKRFGASMHSTPAEQIAAGVRLIKYLDGRLKSRVPDPEERKKFIIAAYNIGLAHIYDAYNLAEKHNKNPEIWADNVEFCLLSKSDPQFYNDPVVKYGRVSGKETQRFVSNVMEKYDHYKLRARM